MYCVNYSTCSDQIIVSTADAKPVVFDKNGNQVRKFIKGNPYVLDNSKTIDSSFRSVQQQILLDRNLVFCSD